MDIGNVSVSIRNTTAGKTCELTLECSAKISPYPLPANVPYPSFEWFFGSTNSSLPLGVILSDVRNFSNNYISSLQFSPLLPHHFGTYTCRLGGNEGLVANRLIPGKDSTPVKIILSDTTTGYYLILSKCMVLTVMLMHGISLPIILY